MKDLYRLYRRVLKALPPDARRFLGIYASLLAALSLFDAAALGLLALIIAPLSSGDSPSLPLIGPLNEVGIIWAIVTICLLMIAKAVAAVLVLRWGTRGFARYELELGNRLFAGYLLAPWEERLKRNSAKLVRLIDNSVAVTIASFVLPGAMLLGEAANLITVIVVLAVAQPLVAAITLVYLGLIGLVLYFWIARHARIAGKVTLTYALMNVRLISEMVGALKEITLRNKYREVAGLVSKNRGNTTRARANVQFLGQVPRFILDSGVAGGFLLIGGVTFLIGGVPLALTAVALFGLAGFRMAPSVVRTQTIFSQLNSTSHHAQRVLDEIDAMELAVQAALPKETAVFPESPQAIEVRNMSFRYGGTDTDAVKNVSLSIPFGQTVAFVGESGSGKSTMIDLILGLLSPTAGDIAVDEVPLISLQDEWRSRLGYVPQEVSIFDGNVAQNVALTWGDEFDTEQVRRSLEHAQLLKLIEQRSKGINGAVGERGLSLSGGQKQRLGIARALYSNPRVLVMDEATSALDAETEAAITQSINALHGETTVILVAHRLSTIRMADQIFYLDQGELIAQGTFDELVHKVERFERQARLSGLID